MQRVNKLILLILLVVTSISVTAQNNNQIQKADSLLQKPDSTLLKPLQNQEISIDEDALTIQTETKEIVTTDTINIGSLDSIPDLAVSKVDKLQIKTFKPDSKKAVIYSAIFPGLGQIYNQKYWKLPIIYGGFVGVSYAITWNNSHYQDYFHAYKDILDDDPDTNSWHNFVPYGQDTNNVDRNWFTGVLKDRKNYFRYYRDLSVIIGVALYGLTIVDAYVDAQLFEFDISPDLSFRIEPEVRIMNNKSYYADSSFGFKCSFSF